MPPVCRITKAKQADGKIGQIRDQHGKPSLVLLVMFFIVCFCVPIVFIETQSVVEWEAAKVKLLRSSKPVPDVAPKLNGAEKTFSARRAKQLGRKATFKVQFQVCNQRLSMQTRGSLCAVTFQFFRILIEVAGRALVKSGHSKTFKTVLECP